MPELRRAGVDEIMADIDNLKGRAEKVDDRVVALFKRYPLVGGTVLLVGFGLGFLAGKIT